MHAFGIGDRGGDRAVSRRQIIRHRAECADVDPARIGELRLPAIAIVRCRVDATAPSFSIPFAAQVPFWGT